MPSPRTIKAILKLLERRPFAPFRSRKVPTNFANTRVWAGKVADPSIGGGRVFENAVLREPEFTLEGAEHTKGLVEDALRLEARTGKEGLAESFMEERLHENIEGAMDAASESGVYVEPERISDTILNPDLGQGKHHKGQIIGSRGLANAVQINPEFMEYLLTRTRSLKGGSQVLSSANRRVPKLPIIHADPFAKQQMYDFEKELFEEGAYRAGGGLGPNDNTLGYLLGLDYQGLPSPSGGSRSGYLRPRPWTVGADVGAKYGYPPFFKDEAVKELLERIPGAKLTPSGGRIGVPSEFVKGAARSGMRESKAESLLQSIVGDALRDRSGLPVRRQRP
jgi:hypothetical protein